MATSLNELVYALIELYRANYKVTDSLDERLVAKWIQETRATILSQTKETLRYIDPVNIQTLSNVELELVDDITVPDLANGSKILRTVREIPDFVSYSDNLPMISRVYSSKLIGDSFERVPVNIAKYAGSGKFNQNTVFYFLYQNKIYLISKSGIHRNISHINIDGVFNDPIEAYEFTNGIDSYDWNYGYPVSEKIISIMNDLIVKSKFNFVLYPPQDLANNASDDLTNSNTQE